MQHEDIENLATILNNSGQYRVTKKYQRPGYYNTSNENDKILFLETPYANLQVHLYNIISVGIQKVIMLA